MAGARRCFSLEGVSHRQRGGGAIVASSNLTPIVAGKRQNNGLRHRTRAAHEWRRSARCDAPYLRHGSHGRALAAGSKPQVRATSGHQSPKKIKRHGCCVGACEKRVMESEPLRTWSATEKKSPTRAHPPHMPDKPARRKNGARSSERKSAGGVRRRSHMTSVVGGAFVLGAAVRRAHGAFIHAPVCEHRAHLCLYRSHAPLVRHVFCGSLAVRNRASPSSSP